MRDYKSLQCIAVMICAILVNRYTEIQFSPVILLAQPAEPKKMIMINEKGIVQKLEITTGSSQLHDTVTEKSVTFAWKMDTRPNYTMIDKHLVKKKAQQSM